MAEQGAKAVVIHYNAASCRSGNRRRHSGRRGARRRAAGRFSPPRARSKSCSPIRSPPSAGRISPSIPSAKC
ncbi:hypothetical protein J4732_06825 [Serratia marcescens]|uniref:Uncharacterized protein n=1 Tax=Serratia marcescens TaxID=615 RepID=A0A939NLN8_SERMA|nr:hypothetical protein [Serratia marcescens]